MAFQSRERPEGKKSDGGDKTLRIGSQEKRESLERKRERERDREREREREREGVGASHISLQY